MNPPQLNRMPWNQFYLSPKAERTLIAPNFNITMQSSREGLGWYWVRIGDSAKYKPALVQCLVREVVRKVLSKTWCGNTPGFIRGDAPCALTSTA